MIKSKLLNKNKIVNHGFLIKKMVFQKEFIKV